MKFHQRLVILKFALLPGFAILVPESASCSVCNPIYSAPKSGLTSIELRRGGKIEMPCPYSLHMGSWVLAIHSTQVAPSSGTDSQIISVLAFTWLAMHLCIVLTQ